MYRGLDKTLAMNCTVIIDTDLTKYRDLSTELIHSQLLSTSSIMKQVLVVDYTPLTSKSEPFVPNEPGCWVTLAMLPWLIR